MKLPSESLAMPVQGLSLGLLYEHDCFGRASRHLLATADYDTGLNASPATSTPIIMTVLDYLVISGFAKADRYASLDIQFRPFYVRVDKLHGRYWGYNLSVLAADACHLIFSSDPP
jgi:hypothetical protein